LAAIALVGTLSLTPTIDLPVKAVIVIGCLLVGALMGRSDWREIRGRIYARNRLILYYSDTFLFALFCTSYGVAYAPIAVLRLGGFERENLPLLLAVILAFASMGCGFSVAMYVQIRRYEAANGPLRTKSIYTPSVSGAEGTLGLQAVLKTGCTPEGIVRVHGELWRARALEGTPIAAGETVVIREIEGLCLLVEPLKTPGKNFS